MKKRVKNPPIDHKKPRKPPKWMMDEALYQADESYARLAHGDTLEWHVAENGRLMLRMESEAPRRRAVTSIDRAGRAQQDCYDWLWRRGLVEIQKLGRECYLEICLDRRGLGARDFVE